MVGVWPECSAVEVNHQPLGGVEGEAVGVVGPLHPVSVLGADEGASRIGGVHVHPQPALPTHLTNLPQVIKRTNACSPQRRTHL